MESNIVTVHDSVTLQSVTYASSKPGQTLADIVEPVPGAVTVVSVNGEYYPIQTWPSIEIIDTDVVLIQHLPQGRDGTQSVIAVISVALIAYGIYAQDLLISLIGASLLASAIVPLPQSPTLARPTLEGPTNLTSSLAANSARLGEPMPVIYGRHLIIPDFASQPYTSYGPNDEQFYHCILCYGLMTDYVIEAVTIDDTPIEHFTDVSTQFVGAGSGFVAGVDPLSALSIVDPTIVSSIEVSNQDLSNTFYVGPFAACGPGLSVNSIELDFTAPVGLFESDSDGVLSSKSCTVLVEYRPIHPQYGTPEDVWSALDTIVITRAQNTPVRVSYSYPVTPGRYQVRVSRQDVRDTSARSGHILQWSGLRASLDIAVPFSSDANYLAVKIKASNQLSGLSQRQIRMVIRRKLPHFDGSSWTVPQESRSVVDACLDLIKNTVYGMGLPDANIDLQSFYELDQVLAARGDVFSLVFNRTSTAWESLLTILRCGRARPVMRGSIISVVRDSQRELPVALFSQFTNIKSGSLSISEVLVRPDDTDGVEVEFFDERTWTLNYVRMPYPNTGLTSPTSPRRISLYGISYLRHAQRECAFWASAIAFRSTQVEFTTEMDGFLPAIGDVVGVSHDLFSTTYSGVVEFWAGEGGQASLVKLSEPVNWTTEQHYAVVRKPNGDLTPPLRVMRGSSDFEIIFTDPIPFEPAVIGDGLEPTSVGIGVGSNYTQLIKVKSIRPLSETEAVISGFVDDPRPYWADLPFTGGGPDSGDGGSPIGNPGSSRVAIMMDDGSVDYAAATESQRNSAGYYADSSGTISSDPPYRYS